MYEVKDRPSDGTQLLEYVQKMTSQPAFSQKISEEPLKGPRSRRSSSTAKAKAVSSSGTTKVNVASLSPEGGVFFTAIRPSLRGENTVFFSQSPLYVFPYTGKGHPEKILLFMLPSITA